MYHDQDLVNPPCDAVAVRVYILCIAKMEWLDHDDLVDKFRQAENGVRKRAIGTATSRRVSSGSDEGGIPN